MNDVIDFCILNYYSRQKGPSVIKKIPENIDFQKQKNTFLTCCFPETHSDNSIYAFSISKYLVFVYSFSFNAEIYSIAFGSRQCFASLFLDFLKDVSKTFKKEQAPEERFTFICDLLSKWKYQYSKKDIKVYFSKEHFHKDVDFEMTFYMRFNPAELIGNEQVLNDIWKTIIKGGCVLLVGYDAEQVSSAVFSILSLFAPIHYADSILLYTGLGDQRFMDIINGSKKWKIVGTTNQIAAERCTQFDMIVKLPKKKISSKEDIRGAIQKKNNRLMKRCEFQLNKSLEIDPYFDILNLPLSDKQINDIVNGTEFSADDLKTFMKSASFTEWRKSIIFRSQFRECFLSYIPESIINRPEDQLKKMLEQLDKISTKFVGDDHVLAVIQQHIKFIKKKLSNQA